MSKQIQIPDIGSDEVTVTEVMVKVGDTITADQSIINVEGDKASMEVPAPEAGVVKEVLVKVGDKVTTGTPMLVLESADAAAPVPAAAAPAPAAAPAAASVVEVNVPDIGSDEVNVTDIMVKVGDTVEVDQSIINVEGDKASMEVPAPVAGVVKEILINVGDKVVTGKLIMKFEVAGAAPAAAPAQQASAPAAAPTASAIKEVNVPDIGGDEVNVTEIMVAVGDSVSEEQSLITVEGDKASMEVPAPFAGVVKEILVKSGDKVSTGSLIMKFEVAGAAPAPAAAPAGSSGSTPPQWAAPWSARPICGQCGTGRNAPPSAYGTGYRSTIFLPTGMWCGSPQWRPPPTPPAAYPSAGSRIPRRRRPPAGVECERPRPGQTPWRTGCTAPCPIPPASGRGPALFWFPPVSLPICTSLSLRSGYPAALQSEVPTEEVRKMAPLRGERGRILLYTHPPSASGTERYRPARGQTVPYRLPRRRQYRDRGRIPGQHFRAAAPPPDPPPPGMQCPHSYPPKPALPAARCPGP